MTIASDVMIETRISISRSIDTLKIQLSKPGYLRALYDL
jgi:acetolactate synthase regulatory subunit